MLGPEEAIQQVRERRGGKTQFPRLGNKTKSDFSLRSGCKLKWVVLGSHTPSDRLQETQGETTAFLDVRLRLSPTLQTWPCHHRLFILTYPTQSDLRLLLGRKVMTNLDSIFKNRDITLPTKVCLVKAMVFPVVMHECESCTIKKAERQRIDAFELWCCRRLLRVPWTARRFNQSILKEISPGCSLEGLMLKLKLLYFGHLI